MLRSALTTLFGALALLAPSVAADDDVKSIPVRLLLLPWLFRKLTQPATNAFPAAGTPVRPSAIRSHRLTRPKPYLDSDLQSRWWDFGGDTIVRTDSYIRLASDRPSQDGWMFSRVPLTATSWEVSQPSNPPMPPTLEAVRMVVLT